MNKSELIAKVAEKAVAGIFASVQEALVAGDKVQVIGFGTFEVRERAARNGRNPKSGEEIKIPAAKSPAFKSGKALKDAVNVKKASKGKKKSKK